MWRKQINDLKEQVNKYVSGTGIEEVKEKMKTITTLKSNTDRRGIVIMILVVL